MDKEQMKRRTKQFALRVVGLVEALPRTRTSDVLGRQLLRAGTAVGAHYRAECRAKSTAHFISKLGDVEEEADESSYWMELSVEGGLMEASLLEPLTRDRQTEPPFAILPYPPLTQGAGSGILKQRMRTYSKGERVMPKVDISEEQLLSLLDELSPAARREALRRLLTGTDYLDRLVETNRPRIETIARQRGLDWHSLSEERREELVDELLHEDHLP